MQFHYDKMDINLAPIVLFVYNRPWHTEQTLTALAQNELAKESVLFIYSDGPKGNATAEDLEKIAETRKVIRKRKWCKEAYIIESEQNKGLADSVIDGTTEIINRYGIVITLEDDVVVSKYFLKFMNDSLYKYAPNKEIYMVSGYTFPANKIKRQNGSFFLPLTSTQAWGTWKRAWDYFDDSAKGYKELRTNTELRKKFNLDDSYDFTSMLLLQMESDSISSWAIRWWWSVFKRHGLILYSDKSLIKNIGWDGSGRHSGKSNLFFDPDWEAEYEIKKFPNEIKCDEEKFKLIKEYLKQKLFPQKPSILKRILKFIKKKSLMGYYFLIGINKNR